MTEQNPRERYRTQVRAEIKQHAWEQIASAGVPALSLNAIAKQMGLSGPALYRYFASRDELITELIRDAYRSLADTVRGTPDLHELARVIRDWARADPQRYFLVYGTPVPGYHAPEDITAISDEVMTAIVQASGEPPEEPDTPFDTHLDSGQQPIPARTLHRALSFWTRLQGVLSLELAGHFAGMAFDPGLLIAEELTDLTG